MPFHEFPRRNENGLTARQQLALDGVARAFAETGGPPSYKELMTALAVRSSNAVHDLLIRLEQKGLVVLRPDTLAKRQMRLTPAGVRAARTVTPCPHCGKPELRKPQEKAS